LSSSLLIDENALESQPAQNDFGKLQWQCRRGMKELDFLLARYLRERYRAASSDERAAFADFLELPDPDMMRYLLAGDAPPDPRCAALCRQLLQSN
jgi:antitoxin CptB